MWMKMVHNGRWKGIKSVMVGEGDSEVGSQWCWRVIVMWCWDCEDGVEWRVSAAKRMFYQCSHLKWREQRKIMPWGVGRWAPLVFIFFSVKWPPLL